MHARVDNYDNPLWPLVHDLHDAERKTRAAAWYAERVAERPGPALVASCGTGQLLLDLLARDVDAHGFDISPGMLNALHARARALGIPDIRRRASRQDLVEFRYDRPFTTVVIPFRAFLHLSTQEDQIGCLRNVRSHLAAGGRLLLDVFNVDHARLVEDARRPAGFRPVGDFPHPDRPGSRIALALSQRNDLCTQTMHLTWRFQAGRDETESRMVLRYVHPEEFRLLFRLAGFASFTCLGNFDADSTLSADSPEQVWCATA